MNLNGLQIAMRMLDKHGDVHIRNCSGVNLIVLGAWLQSIANNDAAG